MSGSDRNHSGDAVRVADLPTRLFHWTLATLVVGPIADASLLALAVRGLCAAGVAWVVGLGG